MRFAHVVSWVPLERGSYINYSPSLVMAPKESTNKRQVNPVEPIVPAKVTESGKMHIPHEVLKCLGIDPGQHIVFVLDPNHHQCLVMPLSGSLPIPQGWHQ